MNELNKNRMKLRRKTSFAFCCFEICRNRQQSAVRRVSAVPADGFRAYFWSRRDARVNETMLGGTSRFATGFSRDQENHEQDFSQQWHVS